jgi:hypothetical protein
VCKIECDIDYVEFLWSKGVTLPDSGTDDGHGDDSDVDDVAMGEDVEEGVAPV